MKIDFAKEMDDFFRENVHKMEVADLLIALIGHGEELRKKYEMEEAEEKEKKPVQQNSANPENCGGSSKGDAGDNKVATVAGDNIRGKRSKNVIVEQEDDIPDDELPDDPDTLFFELSEDLEMINLASQHTKVMLDRIKSKMKESVVSSRWYMSSGSGRVTCARCGLTQVYPATYYNYCPKCGARMSNGDMRCED